MFQGRKLLIATKHEKEKVISPIIESELGVISEINTLFDTDSLGTFSGEIDRKDDVITTLKKKCLQAMDLHNVDLAIASEGSFGAHPSVFFLPGNEEFLILIDLKNNLEITASELVTDTNFNAQFVSEKDELLEFAKRVHFPSHGLILKSDKEKWEKIYKGITNEDELIETFENLKQEFGKAYVETDMRANYNPTRMNVIEKTTRKLVDKIKNECPQCACPGFDVTSVKRGLACSQCNSETQSILSLLYCCKKCNYSLEKMYPNNKKSEDPMYCDYCNP